MISSSTKGRRDRDRGILCQAVKGTMQREYRWTARRAWDGQPHQSRGTLQTREWRRPRKAWIFYLSSSQFLSLSSPWYKKVLKVSGEPQRSRSVLGEWVVLHTVHVYKSLFLIKCWKFYEIITSDYFTLFIYLLL